ncbi:hypothetical protein [Pseudogemmobacter faecipullorum]|uniref:Uncharacterized protein n=1 Tax=Pseudogemmobacter faecipullorum TaxID=2755041 RepID=A0ABS8CQR4_9RHOB|nr:hypothetical protein [Pseudogemmobacter faecipullorum]MCB5411698.1 hypothetical protein [Pseudogemmobacter faecipullorum]
MSTERFTQILKGREDWQNCLSTLLNPASVASLFGPTTRPMLVRTDALRFERKCRIEEEVFMRRDMRSRDSRSLSAHGSSEEAAVTFEDEYLDVIGTGYSHEVAEKHLVTLMLRAVLCHLRTVSDQSQDMGISRPVLVHFRDLATQQVTHSDNRFWRLARWPLGKSGHELIEQAVLRHCAKPEAGEYHLADLLISLWNRFPFRSEPSGTDLVLHHYGAAPRSHAALNSVELLEVDAICAAEELHQREAEVQSKRISEREREVLKAVREAMVRMEQNRADKVSEMRHGTFTPNSIDWADMTPLLMRRLLLEHPKTVIGAICGVSEAAVRKYCAKHEIRQPPRGYWLKR